MIYLRHTCGTFLNFKAEKNKIEKRLVQDHQGLLLKLLVLQIRPLQTTNFKILLINM